MRKHEEAVRLYGNGSTQRDIAKRFGVSQSTIGLWLAKAGVVARRNGPSPRSLADRFWEKVEFKPGDCWRWLASGNVLGYGKILSEGGAANGRWLKAHRVSYELENGPIPNGLVIDHACREPSCVNPAHLEAVTQSENCKRGLTGEHGNRWP